MSGKSRRQAGPRQNRFIGLSLQILSTIGCLVLLAVLFFPGDKSTTSTGWWSVAETVLAILALAGFLGLMGHLLQRGDRHLAQSGADVMGKDRRAPVLYLRPFGAEVELSAEEQTLKRIMDNEVGPLVAVGNPEDALPPLGAARSYEQDFAQSGRTWQLHVREMLLRSSLVFVVPGHTPGLGWEIAQCREVLHPLRLIVLVRGTPNTYDAFRDIASQSGLLLPRIDRADFARHRDAEFVGLIAFDVDWTARFSPFPERPLFEDNGVDRREWSLRRGFKIPLGRLAIAVDQL
jgi:hypothetical protein